MLWLQHGLDAMYGHELAARGIREFVNAKTIFIR